MNLEESHPALTELLVAYFNEDWRDYGTTLEDVVDGFVDDNAHDRTCVRDALDQVSDLLASGRTDEQLTDATIRSGFGDIWPPAFGLTTRGWLEVIRDRLRDRLAST